MFIESYGDNMLITVLIPRILHSNNAPKKKEIAFEIIKVHLSN